MSGAKRRSLALAFGVPIGLLWGASVGSACVGYLDVDAGVSQDASDGGDAAFSEAGEAGTFCERQDPKPTFCDDFDRGSALLGWRTSIDEPDSIDLDPVAASEPFSAILRKRIEGCTPLSMEHDFEPNKRLRVSYKIMPTHTVDGGSIRGFFGALQLRDAQGNGCNFVFDRQSDSAMGFEEHVLGDTSGAQYHKATRSPPRNEWSQFELTFEAVDGAPGLVANVKVDDAPAMTNEALLSCRLGGISTVSLSLNCVAEGSALRVDDVVVDVE